MYQVEPKKRIHRPNGAYKLLVVLAYGRYSFIETMPSGSTKLHSIWKLARTLGTESKRVNKWLVWLSEQGYIESVAWSANRRAVQLRIRQPAR